MSNPWIAWIARLVLLGSSLAIALVIGELVVATVAPQTLSIWDNTRDGVTIHRPDLDVYLPRYDQRIRTNAIGMRDHARSLEKAEDTFRILVLGDSFMEALQVPIERAFPALLEERISHDRERVEVVNLSVSGWGTDDQVTYLERYGMRLDPDGVLVMMTLHNDVSDNARLRFHTFDENGLQPRPRVPMPLPRYAVQKLKAFLAGSSQLYQLAYQTSVRDDVQRGAIQLDRHVTSLLRREASPELERSWALTLALLDKAVRVAEGGDAWLAVGMIPLRVQVEDDAYRELLSESGLEGEQMDREAPQRRVTEWARVRDVSVIDLRSAFVERQRSRGELLYLPHDGHWSEAGHELAADVSAAELVSAGLDLRADR